MSNVPAVTDQSWDAEVLKASTPVLVDFHATWCGPCKALAPVIDEIATEYTGKLKVVKVDVDEAQDTATSLGIMSVPTLMIFKDGKEAMRRVGGAPKQTLMAEIQKNL